MLSKKKGAKRWSNRRQSEWVRMNLLYKEIDWRDTITSVNRILTSSKDFPVHAETNRWGGILWHKLYCQA